MLNEKTPAPTEEKPLRFIGSSRKDIQALPKFVRRAFGLAFQDAQIGEKHPAVKPLKGFGGAGVLEVVEDWSGGSYRAVYTVRFASIVYVLHVFQKKSKSGVQTPPRDLEKIRTRLKDAERHYGDFTNQQSGEDQV